MKWLLGIAILLIVWLIYKHKQLSKQVEIKNLIAWIVTDNDKDYRLNIDILSYIKNAQNQCNILPEFRIAENEWDSVKKIINHLQKDIVQKYFCGEIYVPKSRYVINGDVYFMLRIEMYLSDYTEKYSFYENTICKHVQDAETQEDFYELTDFGLVLYKLYYIAYVYCKNSKIINPKGNDFYEWVIENCERQIKTKKL
jgi:hypothetical protein